MPPKRSTANRTASASRQQSTLSFNGKTSRVTKASQQHQQHGKDLDKKKELLFDEAVSRTDAPEDDDVVELTTKPTTAEKAITQQAEVEARAFEKAASVKSEEGLTGGSKTEDVLGGRAQTSDVGAVGGPVGSGWIGDEETRARKITETQIKKFWREKESDRLVPRVHQQDLGVHERVLRLWDVSGEYGPCIGIARLKRWKRANVLGLKPPIEVLAVLLQEMDGADGAKVQRAYVDSLMSSRFIET